MNQNEYDPYYFDGEYEDDMPEQETYQKIFSDGSRIILNEFEAELHYPNRRNSYLWEAEKVDHLIKENEWSNEKTIEYLERYYL